MVWTFRLFNSVRRQKHVWLRRPERAQGDRGESIAEAQHLLAEVYDEPVDKVRAELCFEDGKMAKVGIAYRQARFDLHADDVTGRGLGDQVNFVVAVAVAVVEQPHVGLGPGGLLAQFVDNEGFGHRADVRRGWLGQRRRVDVEQIAQQPSVNEVDLRATDGLTERVTRPRSQ